MSDHHDWDSWLSALDEVRPTPADVKKRIRQRALSSSPARSSEEPPEGANHSEDWTKVVDPNSGDLHLTHVELVPAEPEERTGARGRISAGLAVAAAFLVGALLWFGWPDQPESDLAASSFPNSSSELACQDLLVTSENMTFLDRGGPTPLTVEQLNGLRTAFAAFVDELESIGFTDPEALRAWRGASAELRQAAIFASSGATQESALLLERIRDQVFDLVWNSNHRVVETCFEDWTAQ